MIPTLEEWMADKEFCRYSFEGPTYFDGGTQFAMSIRLKDGRKQAMKMSAGYLRTASEYDLVRHMKRTLVDWAESRGY